MSWIDTHKDEITQRYGQKLRQARHEAHLTLEDLADQLGLSVNTLRAYEQGTVKINLVIQIALAKALDQPLSFFLSDLEERFLDRQSLDTRTLQVEKGMDPIGSQIDALFMMQEGIKARYRGEYATAVSLIAQSKGIFEEMRDKSNVASTLVALGDIARARGDWKAAERDYREAVEVMEQMAPRKDTLDGLRHAQALWALSRVPAQQGNYGEALELLERARSLASDSFSLEICGRLAGRIYLAQGDVDRARRTFSEALTHARRTDHPHGVVALLIGLARVALAEGNQKLATRHLNEASTIAREEEFEDDLEEIRSIRSDHDL
jgi:transcriptional regulator with XRE-family HTH domain